MLACVYYVCLHPNACMCVFQGPMSREEKRTNEGACDWKPEKHISVKARTGGGDTDGLV